MSLEGQVKVTLRAHMVR